MSKDDWGIDGFPFVEEQPPQEQEPMTDKTQYCPLCEAAQREIVELKAERLKPIDEAIAEFDPNCSDYVTRTLKEIRAKYEKE